MTYYIKVTTDIARQLVNINTRNETADGNILLWMNDLNSIQGRTLAERAERVGGALLTPEQAKEEISGANSYANVYTPSYYGGAGKESGNTNESTDENTNESTDENTNESESIDEKDTEETEEIKEAEEITEKGGSDE